MRTKLILVHYFGFESGHSHAEFLKISAVDRFVTHRFVTHLSNPLLKPLRLVDIGLLTHLASALHIPSQMHY